MTSISSYGSFSSRGVGGMSMGGWGSSARSSQMGTSVVSRGSGSVYAGAGGKGTRISTSISKLSSRDEGISFGSLGGGGGGIAFSMEASGDGAALAINEKQTMQSLNDRLAKYLEKVRTLEAANAKLEEQIRAWGINRATVTTTDVSAHRITISKLRSEILAAAAANLDISVRIDNVKLAADDFKFKYENELSIRQCVEADIAGLKRMMSELALAKRDIELQLEAVKEETAYLNKNHEEDTLAFREKLSGQVQVEVESAPSVDLSLAIAEIREQYEGLVAKNQRDVEAWFKNKSAAVQQDLQISTEVRLTKNVELKDSLNSLRNLEIELQSVLSMKATLEGTLAETEARYVAQMGSLQTAVTGLEEQLLKLRGDIELQGQNYKDLLNIKSQLEMEISEYRMLLEGWDSRYTTESSVVVDTPAVELETKVESVETQSVEESSSVTVTKKVITVVEEVVDGVVVSSTSSAATTVTETDAADPSILEEEAVQISPEPE